MKDSDSGEITKELINWSVYSENYDALCDANPAYQENVNIFRERLKNLKIPSRPRVCDLGAGTGNFLIEVGKQFPGAELHHVDWNESMTAIARKKYDREGLEVVVHERDIRDVDFPQGTFDLVVCVNAIYAMPEPDIVLRNLRNWTNIGGFLYVIDFGRQVQLIDWAYYILKNRVKELGLRNAIRWYRDNAENLKQNRKGAKAQTDGSYWLHSNEEFATRLQGAGWEIELLETCYRDCCDLAVCTNPPS